MSYIEERIARDRESFKAQPPVVPTELELKKLAIRITALSLRLEMLEAVGFGETDLSEYKSRYVARADEIVPFNDYQSAVNVAEYRKKHVNPKVRRPNRGVYQRMRARNIFGMDSWVARHFAAGKATRKIKDEDNNEKVVPYTLSEVIDEDSQRLESLEKEWWRGRARLKKGLWLTREEVKLLDKLMAAVLTSIS